MTGLASLMGAPSPQKEGWVEEERVEGPCMGSPWVDARSVSLRGCKPLPHRGACRDHRARSLPRDRELLGLRVGAAKGHSGRLLRSSPVLKASQHRLHLEGRVEILGDAAQAKVLQRAPEARVGGQHGERYG